MTPRRTLLCLIWLAALSVSLPAGELKTPKDAKKLELEKAPAETVTTLLEGYGKAVEAEDAELVIKALTAMLPYENPEFVKPALEALKYRASKVDRRAAAAKAKGKGKEAKEIAEKALLGREEGVQVVAARLLANCPDEKTGKTLHKLLAKKEVRDRKARLRSRIMLTMGHIGYTKAWELIQNEFRRQADNGVMRAAVLYFGMTKEKRAAVDLTGFIDNPGDKARIHGGHTKLTGIWMHIRADVTWALKEITGQEFETTKEGRDWVRDHFKL